ncbi:MAG: ABC transporter permease [Bacteroidales bacterium]|nr:ABC transporter permease [Bacteroidales bacterium]
MKDLFAEIWLTMRANKQRTLLTGFSIAWGIFMLIVLLGAGNGLQNGMLSGFRYMSKNSLSLYPGYTSMPYNGMQKGRVLHFTPADVEFLRTHLEHVSAFSPIYNKWDATIVNGTTATSSTMSGVEPGYESMRNLLMVEGRFVNVPDNSDSRKVVVLHESTAKILFPQGGALGSYVQIDKVLFRVVGIYTEEGGGGNRTPSFYIPLNTAQAIFNPSGYIDDVSFTVEGIHSEAESKLYTDNVRRMLAQRLQFDPADQNALWIADRLSNYLQTQTIFGGIALFVWIIGIGTLIAGVVGVSNIMLITVKERTHEFGIRKALGATPHSILRLVVIESLVITTMFGYIGMFCGVALTEAVATVMAQMGTSSEGPQMFTNPTVDLGIVLAATVILVVAGAVSGYIPAKRAVNVKPIEALQHK